jgi:hypothetical protein
MAAELEPEYIHSESHLEIRIKVFAGLWLNRAYDFKMANYALSVG